MTLENTEFYSTPDGEVMVKECDKPVRLFEESDRDLVQEMFMAIRDRYSEAFQVLSELYTKSERNRFHFEYLIVHRFVRCNFGEYDQYKFDIDHNGAFQFEEVKCPLRGECKFNETICKPKLNTTITDREKDVMKLITSGLNACEVARELSISIATVNRHRENIKAKLKVRNLAEMGQYYATHFNNEQSKQS